MATEMEQVKEGEGKGMCQAAPHASYLRYFLMGSQATSRITMEGSSSRRALMAEIYRVMMSEVLTPTGEEQRESESCSTD